MSTQRKSYDYAKACIKVALREHPISDDFKRILRRLVREAAKTAIETHELGQSIADFDSVDVNGIAKVLVP